MRRSLAAAALLLAAVSVASADDTAARWWAHVSFLARRCDERPRHRQPRASEGGRVRRRRVQARRPEAGRHRRLLPAGPLPLAPNRRGAVEPGARATGGTRRAGRARRRSDLLDAHRAGARGRGADRVRRLRSAGAGGEARRPGGARSEGQDRAATHRRPVDDSRARCWRTTRPRAGTYLQKAGAIGVLSIQNPKGQDIPWDRSKLARFMPSLAIADPALDETLGAAGGRDDQPGDGREVLRRDRATPSRSCWRCRTTGKVLPRFADAGLGARRRSRSTRSRSSRTTSSASCRGTDPVLQQRVRRRLGASRSRRRRRADRRRSRSTTARWTTPRASRR